MRMTPFLALALLPGALPAQSRQVVAEVGASSFLPPVGVEGEAASYLMAGLRGEWLDLSGSGASLSLLGGRATDGASGGDFLSGELAAGARTRLATRWTVGGEARLSGFTVSDPFPYRAVALEGELEVGLRTGPVRTTVSGTGGWGESRVDLFRYSGGPVRTVVDGLWRGGATLEVLAGSGKVAGGATAGTHRSAGGDYASVGARLLFALAGGAVELRLDRWDTPLGTETTGGVSVVLPLGRWTLRGFGGRSEPDPLILAEPGRGGGGALLGLRLLGGDGGTTPAEVLHRVVERAPTGSRIRFRLPDPGAEAVELLGDFTLWEPVPMRRDGDAWVVELTIPAGTHHFGFHVDGEWYLPDDAPDAAPDEWGRRNATLVVEEGS